jgi:acyl carrier protein
MALRDELTRFIAERLMQNRDATVDPEDNLLDLGLIDSVGLLNLITFLESTAGIRVPEEEMVPDNFESVVAIEAFVARMRAARS